MSDNEEVSLIRTKKPMKNIKEIPVEPIGDESIMEPNIAMPEQKVKKPRPPKTEKQLEASKKMLEARRLQCEKIKEEKLAKQYEAYKKVENKVMLQQPKPQVAMPKQLKAPVKELSDTEEEEEEEEEIIVVKKPKTKPLKKKKIVIVQQSESEDDESEEEEQRRSPDFREIVKPKPKQHFGKSQQNIKSKISIGNQKPNWENYFC
jgi:hypothetical protein